MEIRDNYVEYEVPQFRTRAMINRSIKDLLHGRERKVFWRDQHMKTRARGYSRVMLRSLSNDVFERQTSTGSGLFVLFSRDFEQILGQNVCLRVKTLSNANMVASRRIKKEKGLLPVNVLRLKRCCLKSLWHWALLFRPQTFLKPKKALCFCFLHCS